MDDSYSSNETIQCPFCGKSFEAQFWIIIDVVKRPDLLEQLRAGEMGQFICPHCKKQVQAASALVLYDARQRQRFTFSPPDGMSQADAHESSFQIVSLFRQRAGRQWQDAWLGGGVPIIPRNLLRFQLLTELSQRWRTAIQLASTASRSHDPGEISRALDAWQQILAHPDFDRLPDNFQWSALNNRGGLLLTRFRETKQRADLDQAIADLEDVFERMPPDAPDRPGLMRNLDQALTERFAVTADLHDLDIIIDEWQQALSHIPPDSTARPTILGNLGDALLRRYKHVGNLADLERALDFERAALRAAQSDPEGEPTALVSLSGGLHARYVRLGRLADLNEAIALLERADKLLRPGDARRGAVLSDLGVFLNLRYESNQKNSAELDRAIDLLRKGLTALAADAPQHATMLGNLASALHNRYKQTGSQPDLEEAIATYREALAAGIPDPSAHAGTLSNLAYVLRDRYELTHSRSDLDESIADCQRALEVAPERSPARAIILNTLASSLEDRFNLFPNMGDLVRTQAAYREACTRGFDGMLVEGTLRASQKWGHWALERSAWEEAREAYRYGMQAVDRLFHSQLLREDKEIWLRRAQNVHIGAAYAAARCNEPGEAVVALEQGRARLVAEASERARRDLERLNGIGQSALLARYQAAATQVAALEKGGRSHTPADAPASGHGSLDEAVSELDMATGAIRQVPGYEDFFKTATFEVIQHTLTAPLDDAGATAVGVYLVLGGPDGFALIVHPGGASVCWLSFDEGDLDRLLVKRDAAGNLGGYLPAQLGVTPLQPELDSLLTEVGEQLIRPVAEAIAALPGTGEVVPRPLVLIPTGRLSLLPLHAARYQRDGHDTTLLDDFAVTYIPSAHILRSSRAALAAQSEGERTLLAVVNPLPLPAGAAPLRYAGAEVDRIAARFDRGATILSGEAATRAAVAAALGTTSHFHVACHATFDPIRPLESGVILSKGERLALSDLIAQRQLKSGRLGVLSACQTAITDFDELPEEAMGLPAGFLQAGLPAIVGSLWSVDDRSTAYLMIKFYEAHFGAHLPPIRALCQAQRWLRDVTNAELDQSLSPDLQRVMAQRHLREPDSERDASSREPDSRPFAHPYYWAAFALYGL